MRQQPIFDRRARRIGALFRSAQSPDLNHHLLAAHTGATSATEPCQSVPTGAHSRVLLRCGDPRHQELISTLKQTFALGLSKLRGLVPDAERAQHGVQRRNDQDFRSALLAGPQRELTHLTDAARPEVLPVSGLEPREPDCLEQLSAEQVAGHDPRQLSLAAQVLNHFRTQLCNLIDGQGHDRLDDFKRILTEVSINISIRLSQNFLSSKS